MDELKTLSMLYLDQSMSAEVFKSIKTIIENTKQPNE